MQPISHSPGSPLLLIVEGESDVQFLTALSTILHRHNPDLPDLAQITAKGRAVFLTTGGSNLKKWASRIASLHKCAWYLFDREAEPETSARQQIVEAVNLSRHCQAILTRKRAVENYLHPLAIQETCGIELTVDDDTNVARVLALKLMERGDESCWHHLPCKRQRRFHAKAKKALNVKAAQRMTPTLLAQRDPEGEVIGWLQTIRLMIA